MLFPAFNDVNSTYTMQNVDSKTVNIVMFGYDLPMSRDVISNNVAF